MELTPLAVNSRLQENSGAELNEPVYVTFENSGDGFVGVTSVTKTLETIMSAISHGLILGFTIYMLCLSFQNVVLFSWHPACMTIGTYLLMAEAVMAMSPNNFFASKLKRHNRVRLHFILQAGAAGFMFAGFLIIFINKNIHNKYHFQSWHGIFGLTTVLLVAVTAMGGILALYAINLKKMVKPAQIKFLHNFIGILTFVLGVITLILGLFSKWFEKNTHYSTPVICTIVVVLAAIFALESAIKSAYSRFKNIYLSR